MAERKSTVVLKELRKSMLVKQNGKMVWYDLRPPSRPEPKNNYKSKQKTAPKPKSNEKHAPAEPKPKPYEEMLASLPKCTVDLGDLLSDEDIARVQAKLKRDAKVKAIQEKIKMMPVLKIVEVVDMAFKNEPNLIIANDEIVYDRLSEETLELMHAFLFPKANVNPVWFDDPNDVGMDSVIELFSGNRFNNDPAESNSVIEYMTNNDAPIGMKPIKVGFGCEIISALCESIERLLLEPVRDMSVERAVALFSKINIDETEENRIKIEMPWIDNETKVSFIIDKDMWLDICLVATEFVRNLIGGHVSITQITAQQETENKTSETVAADWFNEIPKENTVQIEMPWVINQPKSTLIIDKDMWFNFCSKATVFLPNLTDDTYQITMNSASAKFMGIAKEQQIYEEQYFVDDDDVNETSSESQDSSWDAESLDAALLALYHK